MAQTGDVKFGNVKKFNAGRVGTGGSDKPDLPSEFNKREHGGGACSMARANAPNSANSQFFICFADSSFLDGQYTVWGQVLEGMQRVDKITRGAETTGAVANPHQRCEGESSAPLPDLRYAIDIDHPRFAKPIVATISGVVFASTIVASAVTSIVVATIWIWVLVNVSHHWFLELQPGVAGCVGEGRYTAMVFVSSAVKNHRFDASCSCAFS